VNFSYELKKLVQSLTQEDLSLRADLNACSIFDMAANVISFNFVKVLRVMIASIMTTDL